MWLLKFHPQKCKFMSIGRKKIDQNYYMMVDNKKIYLEETTAEKDIAVVFEPNLNFRPHKYAINMQKSK